MNSTILIACCRPLTATCWEITLQQAGYVTYFCNTALPDVLALASEKQPGLLLTEATFDNNQGFELARQAIITYPILRCAILMPLSPLFRTQAILTDISGYLPDPLTDLTELLHCVKEISAGRRYISPALRPASLPLDPALLAILIALNVRQKEILRLLARGMTARQIACELRIAEPTVNWHKEEIWHKLGLKGANELKSFAGFILRYL